MYAINNDFASKERPDLININSNLESTDKQISVSPITDEKMKNSEIIVWINEHHKALDDDHETGIEIDHFGKKVVFHIDHIAYKNPSLIYFKGHTEGDKIVHFVKPTSELKIKLTILRRKTSELQKSPFGFVNWDDYENEKYKCTLE